MNKNEAQEKAIQTINGQMIIIACPGSGKTTTLIRRIHHMIHEAGINPKEILMVTFTNAAAKEMRKRYVTKFGCDPGVTFCTIHSLCLAILRKFASYSTEDIIMDYDIRRFFREKIKKVYTINDKEEFITSLMTDISVVKNNRVPLKKYEQKCCDDHELFRQLYESYEEFKSENHKIDFDDMLILAYETMQTNAQCLNWLRKQYRYIQVDEYQDTNFLQRDIIYLLAGDDPNLAVVGDDDQSIYGFRGAKPEVMLNFQNDFPHATVIHMSTNYRSESRIIDKAGELIKRNSKRFLKDFVGFKPGAGSVMLKASKDRAHEVDEVMERVQKLTNAGCNPMDIAILYRTNKQSAAFTDYCMEHKIPFICTEGIQNKYKHWIYRDIESFYRLANGKGNKFDLEQVLNHPQRYLNHPSYLNCGLDQRKMVEVAIRLNTEDWKLDNAIDNITAFFQVLKEFKNGTPADALRCMEVVGQYKKYLKDYAKYRNMEPDEFYDIWNSYIEDAQKNNTWESWQNYIRNYEAEIIKASKNEKGIVLSTMHRSKGLEWKHVFIVDCVKGITPFAKAESIDDFEEERRLFYVAMTRAEECLYLYYYYKKNSKTVEPSPYLEEMQSFEKDKNAIYERRTVKKTNKPSIPSVTKGDRICHKSFGDGSVVEVKEDRYIILFDGMDENVALSREWVEKRNLIKRI